MNADPGVGIPRNRSAKQGLFGLSSNAGEEKLLLSPDSGGGLDIVAAFFAPRDAKAANARLGTEYAYRPAERVKTSGTFPPRLRHELTEHQSQLARQNHEEDELYAQWVHPLSP